MCEICNVQNMQKVVLFTDAEIAFIVERISHGLISEENLSEDLYIKTATALKDSVEKGFGKKKEELSRGTDEWELLADLIQSVYPFSAAKQYQFVREFNASILTLPENERRISGINLFKIYYIDYLSTELDSAEYQAKSAKDFFEFQKWNNE